MSPCDHDKIIRSCVALQIAEAIPLSVFMMIIFPEKIGGSFLTCTACCVDQQWTWLRLGRGKRRLGKCSR